MKKAAFLSLGCKTNQYEIEVVKQDFIKKGFEIVDFSKKADWYVINTCTVTNESARKSRQMIRKAIRTRRKVAVMGCYSQLEKKFFENIKGIDILCGTDDRRKIIECIDNESFEDLRKENAIEISEYEDMEVESFHEHTRAYVKIEDGCNNFCSYCIIPYARGGNIRSREFAKILNEIRKLSKKGYREVVLTGTNICKYEYDGLKLIDLLKEINNIKEITRVRLGSVYPDYLTRDFIDDYLKLDKMCHHFHVSIQSASNKVLKQMNRKYTKKEMERNLKYIKDKAPDFLYTCDIIVGFPNETKEDFLETYNLINAHDFYHTHVFVFSKREGTKAANMKQTVSIEDAKKRRDKLLSLSDKKREEILKRYVGKQLDVIFEKKENKRYIGHSRNYVKCVMQEETVLNKEVRVKVISYENNLALVSTISE